MAGQDYRSEPRRAMKILVHDISGDLLCELDGRTTQTPAELTRTIHQLEGTDHRLQQLVYNGIVLTDDARMYRTLEELEIPDNAEITLIRLRVGTSAACMICNTMDCHREQLEDTWYVCQQCILLMADEEDTIQ